MVCCQTPAASCSMCVFVSQKRHQVQHVARMASDASEPSMSLGLYWTGQCWWRFDRKIKSQERSFKYFHHAPNWFKKQANFLVLPALVLLPVSLRRLWISLVFFLRKKTGMQGATQQSRLSRHVAPLEQPTCSAVRIPSCVTTRERIEKALQTNFYIPKWIERANGLTSSHFHYCRWVQTSADA